MGPRGKKNVSVSCLYIIVHMICKWPKAFDPERPHNVNACGRCWPCRIKHRRIWGHRIMLEAMDHSTNSFITLTYDDDNLPQEFYHKKTGEVFSPFSVNPYHHRKFMDDIRYAADVKLGVKNIRFYGVGEYGEKTGRPHYHYAFFGWPPCELPDRPRLIGRTFRPCPCRVCTVLHDTWKNGHTFSGTLTLESANYIAGYITKKLTHNNSRYNQERLRGRHWEFARMSNRPGIASWVSDNIANKLNFYSGLAKGRTLSVPSHLLQGSKMLPLGRYLRNRVDDQMGVIYAPNEKAEKWSQEVRLMLENSPNLKKLPNPLCCYSPSEAVKLLNSQSVLDFEKRMDLFRKEKTI